jgi:hypothetical protein
MGAGAGAAAAAAIARAIKAAGAIVNMEPAEFSKLLAKSEAPVIVHAIGGVFTKKHRYLLTYKGFFFFTKSVQPLQLPYKTEMIEAKTIWIPE